ncbi:MAG: hypothetical protein AB1757_04465 [Acidobacteriota bacterium]
MDTTRTEIIVETHEVMVIRRRSKAIKPNCPVCSEDTTMLSLDEATAIFGLSTLELCQLVNDKKIHFTETAIRVLLVCPESLAQIKAAAKSTNLGQRYLTLVHA